MKIIPLIILGLLVSLQGKAQLAGNWYRHDVSAANIADTTEIYRAIAGTWVDMADTAHTLTFNDITEYGFKQYSEFDKMWYGNYWLLDSIIVCNKTEKVFSMDFCITESMAFFYECALNDNDAHLTITMFKGEKNEIKTEYKRKL